MPHSPSHSFPALLKQMWSVPTGTQDVKGNCFARVRLLGGALLPTEEPVFSGCNTSQERTCTCTCTYTHHTMSRPILVGLQHQPNRTRRELKSQRKMQWETKTLENIQQTEELSINRKSFQRKYERQNPRGRRCYRPTRPQHFYPSQPERTGQYIHVIHTPAIERL